MSTKNTKIAIADAVAKLIDSEPESLLDLQSWYREAEGLKDLMVRDVGDLRVPHLLWHFVSDADIRRKDRTYAADQIAGVREALRKWGDEQ